MTHAEEILYAAAILVRKKGRSTFTRKEVRDQIGLKHGDWMAGYTAIFQGMRIDQPGRDPLVAEKYVGVFKRLERGVYCLTPHGRSLVDKIIID